MGDSSNNNGKIGDTGMIELTGKIMVVAIVLLFFVVVFVFCLHLYAKWFWYRRQETTAAAARRQRRRRLDFAAGHQGTTVISAAAGRGLDPSVLKTIPVLHFDPKEFRDGLECAVCLCEVSEGEKARLLPKCSHGFHVDCIDMWFQSHSTCPLCRNPVNQNPSNCGDGSTLETILQAPMGEGSGVDVASNEAPNFPTNVLIWGNETQVSTFGPCVEENHQCNAVAESSSSSTVSASSRPDGISVVVNIPRPGNEEDEQKSAMVPTRLRSLKRLLSGNRRVNPSSPRFLDLEQGGRGPS